MKLSNIIKGAFILLCAAPLLLCCRKQDHFYKDFIQRGEIVYVGKADSILFYPGDKRAQLSFIIADPNVHKMKIYWDERQDSMTVDVTRKNKVDTLKVIIPNLDERFYAFEVYAFDVDGNRSVKSLAEGQVYGDNYQESVFHRAIRSIFYENNQAMISWFGAAQSDIGSEIRYIDMGGEMRTIFAPGTDAVTILEDVAYGESFEYRTLHRPDTLAIDTFYTEFQTEEIVLIEKELDYSKFATHRLENDPPDFGTNRVPFLWNGNLTGTASGSGGWYRTETNSGVPNQITIDMGEKTKLSRFILWQRGVINEHSLLYANANPRTFELWGSNDPTPDGNYSSWEKLIDAEIIRPSGQNPGTTLTPEDLAAAQAGHEFAIPSEAPAVRYIRIKVTETFAIQPHFFISNIGVFGQPYPL